MGKTRSHPVSGNAELLETYLSVIQNIERVHWSYTRVIRDAVRKLGPTDINSTEAIILFNISEKTFRLN